VAQAYQTKVSAKKAEGSTSQSSGFIDLKTEQNFRENGAQLKIEIRNGDLSLDEAYQQLRDFYTVPEVSDQAIRSYLGIPEPTPQKTTIVPKETSMGNVLTTTENSIYDFLFKK
jgi:hypothetical protein